MQQFMGWQGPKGREFSTNHQSINDDRAVILKRIRLNFELLFTELGFINSIISKSKLKII